MNNSFSMRARRRVLAAGLAIPMLALTACGGSKALDIFDNLPEGVKLTKPGTTLSFGEAAQIVEPGVKDEPNTFFEITVTGIRTIPRAEAEANAGGEFTGEDPPENITCIDYTIKYLGSDGNPNYLSDPHIVGMNASGGMANSVMFGGSEGCGITDEDTLPPSVEDVEEGREYKESVMSFEQGDSGTNAVGAYFSYNESEVGETKEDEDLTISWKE